jgi:tetratricopeptide (TPR) repeat protein
LVRLHAAERAAAEESDAEHGLLAERLLAYFLVRAAFADRADRADRLRVAHLDALLSGHEDPFGPDGGKRAVAWLETERHTILALVENAVHWNQPVKGWQLAEGFSVLFLHHRHLRDWLALAEAGAACAVGHPAARARFLSLASRPLMDLGEYERAREKLDEAVLCAAESGNTALHASVLEFFGRYWDHADPETAVAVYQESVRLNEEAGEQRGAAIALGFLGATQDSLGRHGEALQTLRDARRRLLDRDDQRMAARTLASIGRVHDHMGDTAAAVDALSEAARVLRDEVVDAAPYEAPVRVDLARVVERTGGDPRTEREHLSRAWRIYTDGGSRKADEIRARLDELGGPLPE